MSEKQLQEILFLRIREQLAPGRSLVDAVAALLHVSQNSADRRIRGDTLLVLEEARVLCEAFNVSPGPVLHVTGQSIVFQNTETSDGRQDFQRFLRRIGRRLLLSEAAREKSIVYPTDDILFLPV